MATSLISNAALHPPASRCAHIPWEHRSQVGLRFCIFSKPSGNDTAGGSQTTLEQQEDVPSSYCQRSLRTARPSHNCCHIYMEGPFIWISRILQLQEFPETAKFYFKVHLFLGERVHCFYHILKEAPINQKRLRSIVLVKKKKVFPKYWQFIYKCYAFLCCWAINNFLFFCHDN